MQYFIDFNIEEFFSDYLSDKYLEYLLSNDTVLQKDIIAKLDIPHASFTRAKKKGFSSNKKIQNALLNYYGIKKGNIEDYQKLNTEINLLFTYIYYNNATKQQESFIRLKDIYTRTKNTTLGILTLALISIAINSQLFEYEITLKDELKEKVSLFEYILHFLNEENKTIITYSLFEYALHIKNNDLAIHYGIIIESYGKKMSEKLQVMMDYAVMNTCFFSKDFLKGIIYANKVISAQTKYFSPVIRTTAIYALTIFYAMLEDYDKIIATAENELVYLQFDEEHQLQYFGMLSSLISAFIVKENYQKAESLINVMLEYKYEEHTKINKAYYRILDSKKNMMVLYKLFISFKLKEKNYDELLNQVQQINDKEIQDYSTMIQLLVKGNKMSLKKLQDLLKNKAENNMILGYSNIYLVIKKEFDMNKKIDV